jgi:hypothetical protein
MGQFKRILRTPGVSDEARRRFSTERSHTHLLNLRSGTLAKTQYPPNKGVNQMSEIGVNNNCSSAGPAEPGRGDLHNMILFLYGAYN